MKKIYTLTDLLRAGEVEPHEVKAMTAGIHRRFTPAGENFRGIPLFKLKAGEFITQKGVPPDWQKGDR